MIGRAALGCVLGLVALASAPTATAAPDPPAEDRELVLTDQDFALAPGDPWTVTFTLADRDGDLAAALAARAGAVDAAAPPALAGDVVVRVYPRLDDRGELAEILDGARPPIADGASVPLADALRLRPDGTVTIDLSVPTDTRRGAGALTLARAGIYPVSVTVRRPTAVAVTHHTFVRRLPDDTGAGPDPSLGIALVAALTDPGPTPSPAALAAHRTELDQLAVFGSSADVPMTLAFPPALATVLERDELLHAELDDALTRAELVSLPLLTLDPSAAAGADRMLRFASEVREGEDTLAQLFPGVAVRRGAWIAREPLSGPAAAALRDPLGYRMLVFDHATYLELPGTIGGYLDPQRLIAASPGEGEQDVAAAVVDPVGALLAPDAHPDGPVGAAVEVLARLLVARQDIGPDDRRTAVLALDDWALPDAATVEALAALVADQPDVELVTLSEVAGRTDSMRVDDEVTRVELPAEAGPDLSPRLARIELVLVATESAGSMLPTSERRQAWQDRLDGLVSTGIDDEAAQATLDAVSAEIDAVLSSVEAPGSFSFTLTGRTSEFSINVRNHADETRTVRIRPSSAKLTFPDGDQVVTLQPGSNEIAIPVEARSNGTSSVEIQLLTPLFDQRLGPPAILEARVNALTGLGQTVTGVAVLLLVSWWYSHYRRRRRQFLEPVPAEGMALDDPISPDAAEAAAVPPGGRDERG